MSKKIFSGVPIPASGIGAPQKYPFDDMKPGDHFIHTCKPGENVRARSSSISTAASNRGYKVTTRADGNKIRVWLVGPKNGKA